VVTMELSWPDDPRYRIRDDGTIIGPRGWPLKPQPTGSSAGYLQISVCRDGIVRRKSVHVMVCETFHGPRPPGKQAAHSDGDKLNCRADNLSWKTPIENAADMHTHGTSPRGERNASHKLTTSQVREIRERLASGVRQIELVRAFGVCKGTISRIATGEGWTHV
jgi:hypothetical protein